MFGKKNYKKIMITVLAITMIFGTVALAAEGIYKKKLDATYGRIKFSYDGKDVTKEVEGKYGTPGFTVDDRAYVPVRALADVLGIDIDYDHTSHTAKITDGKVDSKELEAKDKEIAKLKKELNELKGIKEKEDDKKEDKKEDDVKDTLASLKKDINDKYREYEQVAFNINLSEDKGTVSIQINTDLSLARDRNNWVKMRHVDKKYLIEDVVSRVKKALPKYDITGYIYDSSTRENLYTFNQKNAGTLTIANRDYVDDYYDDRYYRDDRYYDDYDKYVDDEVRKQFRKEGISDARLYRIDYTSRKATFEIDFSSSDERKWNNLDRRVKEDMLDAIAEEIERGNRNIDRVDGYIYAGSTRVGRYEKEFGYSGEYY